MDVRKKILLRSTSLFGLEDQDMYINLEINSNFKEIKPDSYENVFDLQKQFDNERNGSRNFTIYGDIDSVYENCDNTPIKVFKETVSPTDTSIFNDLEVVDSEGNNSIGTTSMTFKNGAKAELVDVNVSSGLTYNTDNIFGVKKGSYKVDLVDIDYDVIYIASRDDGKNIIKQRLVFQDSAGVFINYGTDTQEIADDGTLFQVTNDFPFFYGIHWVKIPLEILK